MTEYFRGALFYFLCFLTGCAFATLVFGWSLHSHRIEAKKESADDNAERILRRAFGFGLRQLAFFLFLGACSFSLMGGVLWLRAKPKAQIAGSSGSTPTLPVPESTPLSSQIPQQNAQASRLTGVSLPAGAENVTDASIISSSSQQLQRLVSEVDPQSQLGEVEVVMWRGASGAKAGSIMANTTKALQAAKWLYRETNVAEEKDKAQSGVHEFVAANTGQKKIVTGFWLVTDQFLLLSCGNVLVPSRKPPRT
jgi:hypothetical protein